MRHRYEIIQEGLEKNDWKSVPEVSRRPRLCESPTYRYVRVANVHQCIATLRECGRNDAKRTDRTVTVTKPWHPSRQPACCFVGPPPRAGLTYHQEGALLCEKGFQGKAGLRQGESRQSMLIPAVPHLDSSLQVHGECKTHLGEGLQKPDAGSLDWA